VVGVIIPIKTMCNTEPILEILLFNNEFTDEGHINSHGKTYINPIIPEATAIIIEITLFSLLINLK
jgi:hypothetical protein